MFNVNLTFHPVAPDSMPKPLEDVVVIWNPNDGEPPVLALAYMDSQCVWGWSVVGIEIANPEFITHWAYQPALPAGLQFPAQQGLKEGMHHAHI